MADTKQMTVTKPDVTALDSKAVAKFAAPGVPGRVLNIDCETDGTGTAEVQLKHPDGTVTKLADVTVPELADGEKMALRVRICAGIRVAAKAEVAESK